MGEHFWARAELLPHQRGRGPRSYLIKEAKELPERGLVHAVNEAHFCDEEVENAASCGHRTVLLPRTVDLHLCLSRDTQLLLHILQRETSSGAT